MVRHFHYAYCNNIYLSHGVSTVFTHRTVRKGTYCSCQRPDLPTSSSCGWRRCPAAGISVNCRKPKTGPSSIYLPCTTAAIDVGNNGDLFQFMPSYLRDEKFEQLLSAHGWVRSRLVLGEYPWPTGFMPDNLDAWPDIVQYCLVIQMTAKHAAVGPVNCVHYFNR